MRGKNRRQKETVPSSFGRNRGVRFTILGPGILGRLLTC